MIDRDRILAKLDELDSYLRELRSVVPASFHEYLTVEKRRSSERLLQVAIEAGGALTGSAAGGIVVCCLARNSGKGDHSWISS